MQRRLLVGMAMAMAMVYLCQVMPHEHGVPAHEEPHPPPAHHAHHGHSHDQEGREQGGTEPVHHHHSIAQHLDSHFSRFCPRDTSIQTAVAFLDPVCVPGEVPPPPSARDPEPHDPSPDDPFRFHAPSRAPPA